MMTRRIVVVVALGALALSATFAAAQEKPKIKTGTIKNMPVDDGKAMFQEYCTPCHGKAGKGDGPAALALKKAPADLTKISARNGGVFPEVKINRFISGVDEVAAHGNRDMPVWGSLFKSLAPGTGIEQLRVKNLTDYLKTIQQ
jgi:mono/diheme cytochrome c family protein